MLGMEPNIVLRNLGNVDSPLVLVFADLPHQAKGLHHLVTGLVPDWHVTTVNFDLIPSAPYQKAQLDLPRLRLFAEHEISRVVPDQIILVGYGIASQIVLDLYAGDRIAVERAALLHPATQREDLFNLKLVGKKIFVSTGWLDGRSLVSKTELLVRQMQHMNARVTKHIHQGGIEVTHSEADALQAFLTGK